MPNLQQIINTLDLFQSKKIHNVILIADYSDQDTLIEQLLTLIQQSGKADIL